VSNFHLQLKRFGVCIALFWS